MRKTISAVIVARRLRRDVGLGHRAGAGTVRSRAVRDWDVQGPEPDLRGCGMRYPTEPQQIGGVVVELSAAAAGRRTRPGFPTT